MKTKSSILEFQSENSIHIESNIIFITLLEESKRKEKYNECKKDADLWWKEDIFDRFAEDIFFSFYNRDVKLRKEEFVRLENLLSHFIISKLLEEETYKRFREGQFSTIGSAHASFQAFLIVVTEILKNWSKHFREKDKMEWEDITNEGESIEAQNESDIKKIREKAQKFIKSKGKEIKSLIASSLKNALEMQGDSLNTLEKFLYGPLRGVDKGELQELPIHEKIELARLLKQCKKLTDIAAYLGRFKIIAHEKQVEKISDIPIEPSGVYRSKLDVDTMRHEIAKFAGNEYSRANFFKNWVNRSLENLERAPIKETENVGKGSIIICLDTSGSMIGTKEYKSKAIALSVADIAYSQNRNFVCILFSSKWDVKIVQILPDEKIESLVNKVIEIASIFSGGGTDFEAPLSESINIIKQDEFSDGDILFLTDGFADLSDNFLMEYQTVKVEKNFKTYGLLCDSSDSERDYGKKILEKFCDQIFYNSEIEKDLTFQKAEEFLGEACIKI